MVLFQIITSFVLSEIKLGFTVEKVYINFEINFESYITKISSINNNYFLMFGIETRFGVDYSCEM